MSRTRLEGFTLIELMIAVAIIGVLAAVALPSFLRFQLRALSSEGKSNLAAIAVLEDSYYAEYDRFVAAAATPAAPVGRAKQAWPAPGTMPGCPSCFDTLGFAPEGPVSFQYEVVTAALPGPQVFTAAATADLDADGVPQIWGYVRPLPSGAGALPSTLVGGDPAVPCAATGTWDAAGASASLLSTVGPCEGASGQRIF